MDGPRRAKCHGTALAVGGRDPLLYRWVCVNVAGRRRWFTRVTLESAIQMLMMLLTSSSLTASESVESSCSTRLTWMSSRLTCCRGPTRRTHPTAMPPSFGSTV